MPRIRTLKPSIWSDDTFADLSRDSRLLLLGLISMADDAGRFVASTAAVAGYVFPHDEISPAMIKRWLAEIEKKAANTITFYAIDGRRYGSFRNYRKHQVINKAQASSLPPPPGEETLL